MTDFCVEHKRYDGDGYEYVAFYPTAAERDEHARVLREEDRDAFDIKTWEQ